MALTGTRQTAARAMGEGAAVDAKGGHTSASLSSDQDVANAPHFVACSSLLKPIIIIIKDPGRCSSPQSG